MKVNAFNRLSAAPHRMVIEPLNYNVIERSLLTHKGEEKTHQLDDPLTTGKEIKRNADSIQFV